MANMPNPKGGKCYEIIYRRSYRGKDGKRVYPKKGKAFPIRVEVPCPPRDKSKT